MQHTITVYYCTRLLTLDPPEMSDVIESLDIEVERAPTVREIQIALAAFKLGAMAASKQIAAARGARLERDLMGESEI